MTTIRIRNERVSKVDSVSNWVERRQFWSRLPFVPCFHGDGWARIFESIFIRNEFGDRIVTGRWTGDDRSNLNMETDFDSFHLLRDKYSFRDYLSSKDYLYNLVAKVSFARCSAINLIYNEIISVMECIIAVLYRCINGEKLREN